MRNQFIQIFLATLAMVGCARSSHSPHAQVEAAPPRREDVESVEGMMRAFYEVVNIPPDGPRQWSRDRTLYSPWIRFVATGKSPSGRAEVELWNHQQLVDETEPLIQKGFREREIHRSERRYGNIVHIDSTYETEFGPQGSVTRSRGVNSIEMYFDGKRWWIASVMWMSEDPEHPIPKVLLPEEVP